MMAIPGRSVQQNEPMDTIGFSDSIVGMEFRHLEALLAIAETGSFTAAADELRTVQSNVSEMVRQLEAELGAVLLTRGRRGAEPNELGLIVLERARRVRRELESLRNDVAMVQGLERGDASLGVVGTASRWIVPALFGALGADAPGIRLRVTEGGSERLAGAVADHVLAQAIVTEPIDDHRLFVEHLIDEELVGVAPESMRIGRGPIAMKKVAEYPLVLPPAGNPLRVEIETAAAHEGVTLQVPFEVDGVRLIADLVAAGIGVSILPAIAVPHSQPGLQRFAVANFFPRRLALVRARDVQLTRADDAVRSQVEAIVRAREAHA